MNRKESLTLQGGEYVKLLYYLKSKFSLIKLVDGNYQLQLGEPYWMPEICLGVARYQAIISGIQQEALSWYDEHGDRYFTAEERAEQLADYLRYLGIDPDYLPSE